MYQVFVFTSENVIYEVWMEGNHKPLRAIVKSTSQRAFLHFGEHMLPFFQIEFTSVEKCIGCNVHNSRALQMTI